MDSILQTQRAIIPFIDLATQQKHIRTVLEHRIQSFLDHGQYIMGPEVGELEQALTAFTGASSCISCSSGSDALLMALMAWDVGPGDAVFVPAFTFFASAEMPALLGATVIFVDIDPHTYTMCPEALKNALIAVQQQDPSIYPLPKTALTQKLTPKVVIPVDLFGQPADYANILPLAQQFTVFVLEDASQSFGATYKNQSTCNLGCDCSITSFFPAKPLGCYGDGGALFTNNAQFAQTLTSIRMHGQGASKYDNDRIGLNARLDTFQATVLLAKLDIFPYELCARQEVAQWYMQALADIPELTLPHIAPSSTSVFAQFSIRIAQGKRDTVVARLKNQGIPTSIYYPKPVHIQRAFQHEGYQPSDMPVSTTYSDTILSLPFHPYLEKKTINTITTAITKALL